MINFWSRAQEAELRYWELRKSDPDLIPSPSKDRFAQVLSLVEVTPEISLIDVGSGPYGGIPAFLNRRDLSYAVAVDPLLKYRLFPRNVYIDAVAACAECLPFRHGSFDVVLSVNALDHAMSPGATLREIARCSKGRAQVAMMVHVVEGRDKALHRIVTFSNSLHPAIAKWYGRLTKFAGIFLRLLGSSRFLFVRYDAIRHPFYFSVRDLLSLFSACGVRIRTLYFERSKWHYKDELFALLERRS